MMHLEPMALVEYWLSQGDDNAVEEHLLACGECAAALEWVARFTKGVQEVVRRGNLSVVLPPELLARLSEEGLRVRSYAPPAGGDVQCTVTSQDDLLVGRLRTDLSSVANLDLLMTGAGGELRARLEDIPFRPDSSAEIVLNYPIDYSRQMGHDVLVLKLVTVEQGVDRTVAEYTFRHSPSPQ
jgi:hypothetical protein